MGYWQTKSRYRTVLVQQIDLDRLAKKLGVASPWTSKEVDAVVMAGIDRLCGGPQSTAEFATEADLADDVPEMVVD